MSNSLSYIFTTFILINFSNVRILFIWKNSIPMHYILSTLCLNILVIEKTLEKFFAVTFTMQLILTKWAHSFVSPFFQLFFNENFSRFETMTRLFTLIGIVKNNFSSQETRAKRRREQILRARTNFVSLSFWKFLKKFFPPIQVNSSFCIQKVSFCILQHFSIRIPMSFKFWYFWKFRKNFH